MIPNIPLILCHWHGITETDPLYSCIILYHMWSLYCCEFRFVFSFQPQFLILASTWGAAVDICGQCKFILAKTRNILVQLIFAAGAGENQIIPLVNGYEILIATPPCFLRMLRKCYISLYRLCHLVFHDADIVVEDFTSWDTKPTYWNPKPVVQHHARQLSWLRLGVWV